MSITPSSVKNLLRQGTPLAAVEPRWSISVRLLLAMNGICLGLLLLFVALDYRQEMKRTLSNTRVALEEESAILLKAVEAIRHHGTEGVQEFVDQTCQRMEETHARGHHIIVESGDSVIQAKIQGGANEDLLSVMTGAVRTPEHAGYYEGQKLIVGMASGRNLDVYVSEFINDIHEALIKESFRRLGGSLLLAIIAGIIVNVVLLRIVVRPLAELSVAVNEIGNGNYGGQVNDFRSRELYSLARAVNHMSVALAEKEDRRRIQLDKARRIQRNLLPEHSDISGAIFAALYVPAEEVAGDFYDIFCLADGSWIVFLADVTGHGIPAAMNATLLKTHFEDACERFDNLSDIARHINRRFTTLTLPEDFATAILIRFKPQSRILQVINAGHDAVLLRRRDGQNREFKSSGLLLGITEDSEWSVEEYTTSPGDRMLLYTDGVTETFDCHKALFGRHRVALQLNSTWDKSPSDALKAMANEVNSYRGDGPQCDDITAITIEF